MSELQELNDEANDLQEVFDAWTSEFADADEIPCAIADRIPTIENDIGFLAEDRSAIVGPLDVLKQFASEAEGYADDWHYGAQLIRDSYFQRYAMERAEDTGAIPDDASWPVTCIDWEQAALELQVDYSAIDLKGVTYWVR